MDETIGWIVVVVIACLTLLCLGLLMHVRDMKQEKGNREGERERASLAMFKFGCQLTKELTYELHHEFHGKDDDETNCDVTVGNDSKCSS